MTIQTSWTNFENLDSALAVRTKLNALGTNITADINTTKNEIEYGEQFAYMKNTATTRTIQNTPVALANFQDSNSVSMVPLINSGTVTHSIGSGAVVELYASVKIRSDVPVILSIDNAPDSVFLSPFIINGISYVNGSIRTVASVSSGVDMFASIATANTGDVITDAEIDEQLFIVKVL